jgi:hypothetical protein
MTAAAGALIWRVGATPPKAWRMPIAATFFVNWGENSAPPPFIF